MKLFPSTNKLLKEAKQKLNETKSVIAQRPPRIFISYSAADETVVQIIRGDLVKAGINVCENIEAAKFLLSIITNSYLEEWRIYDENKSNAPENTNFAYIMENSKTKWNGKIILIRLVKNNKELPRFLKPKEKELDVGISESLNLSNPNVLPPEEIKEDVDEIKFKKIAISIYGENEQESILRLMNEEAYPLFEIILSKIKDKNISDNDIPRRNIALKRQLSSITKKYFHGMLRLIRNLYGIDPNDKGFEDLKVNFFSKLPTQPKEILAMPGTNTQTATTSTGAASSSTSTAIVAPAVIADVPASSNTLKTFTMNPHSLEAYLAEFEEHWPDDFQKLCTESVNAIAELEAETNAEAKVAAEAKVLATAAAIKKYIVDFQMKNSSDGDSIQWLLLCVAYYGNPEQVEELIKEDIVDGLAGTEGQLTVMHIAVLKGNQELFDIAQELRFSLIQPANFGSYSNVLPVHCAIIAGQLNLLSQLETQETFSTVTYRLGEGEHNVVELGWLSLAAYSGQWKIVMHLIENNKAVPIVLQNMSTVLGMWGGNVLHVAVESNQQQALERLLSEEFFQSKTYLEGRDTYGLTPFALAAKLGNLKAMKSLKESKAHLEVIAKGERFKNYRPIHLATESAQEQAVTYLLHWKVTASKLCHFQGEELNPYQLALKQVKQIQSEIKSGITFDVRQGLNRISRRYRAIAADLQSYDENADLRKFDDTSAKKVIYKNLVFKGGGPKGLVYVGALLKLLDKWQANDELKNLASIERVAGTSAGAIIAVLLAVGYTPQEISDLLKTPENQPSTFLDGQPLSVLSKHTVSSKILEGLKTTALHPMQVGALLVNLARKDSICEGAYFLKLIEGHIKKKTDKDWCTFGELRKLVESQSERKYRHLHVVTVRVSPNTQIEVLSSEDPRYDNYTISHAIRASMSIPVLFKPAHLYQLNKAADGTREAKPIELNEYIDGGVLANYPLKLFDQAQYVEQGLHLFRDERSKMFPVYNEATLGLYIKPEKPVAEPVYTKPGKLSMKEALSTLYSSTEDRIHEFEQNSRRSIEIENAGVTLFDFNLTDDQKAGLLKAGQDAVDASSLVTPTRSASAASSQQGVITSSAALRQTGSPVVSTSSVSATSTTKKPVVLNNNNDNDDDDDDKVLTAASKSKKS